MNVGVFGSWYLFIFQNQAQAQHAESQASATNNWLVFGGLPLSTTKKTFRNRRAGRFIMFFHI
jgi:hypothetical protein